MIALNLVELNTTTLYQFFYTVLELFSFYICSEPLRVKGHEDVNSCLPFLLEDGKDLMMGDVVSFDSVLDIEDRTN